MLHCGHRHFGKFRQGQRCASDGSSYEYSESLNNRIRLITVNHCPNHPTFNLNLNYAISVSTNYRVPLYPQFLGTATDSGTESASIDLSSQGGPIGVAFSGAKIYSPFGGASYGAVTGYNNSAVYAEGNTFDQCGGHSSSTSEATYHYHGPPSCLLSQLGQEDASHSPQIGWAQDGFPVYGPRGPSGVMMQTCTVTGGTYGTDTCTDDCGGYYSDDDSIDNFVYRYYMMGEYDDGTSCDLPGCPSSTSDYHPASPLCFRGCCPDGVQCSWAKLPDCNGTYENGYTASYSASIATVNNMSLESGLPTNTGGCACSALACNMPCDDSDWENNLCGSASKADDNCPTMSPTESPTMSPTTSPTLFPTLSPTMSPTESPTMSPTVTSSSSPTVSPTMSSNMSSTPGPTISETSVSTASGTLSITTTDDDQDVMCTASFSESSGATSFVDAVSAAASTVAAGFENQMALLLGVTINAEISDLSVPGSTSNPTMSPTTLNPTMSPTTSNPTMSLTTSNPTMSPTSNIDDETDGKPRLSTLLIMNLFFTGVVM